MINELKAEEVFVFGSNLAGRHGAGVARQALQWGVVYGVGEGLCGQTYSFPTLDSNLQKRSMFALSISVDKFYTCANQHPELIFLLTEVGCGLAGFTHEEIAPFFHNAPSNVVLPERFLEILDKKGS